MDITKEFEGTVTIIILAWNQLHYTKICIDSIKKFTDKNKYNLIIVDQGSEDETLKYLEEALIKDRDLIIRNKENKGFSVGNNQALTLAEGEYVLFLNNDCEIKDNNWLDSLFQASKEENVGLVGTQCHKVIPDYKKKKFKYAGRGKIEDEWSYIEGWCLFGKLELFHRLNGFDIQFNPIYGEDSDLSYRIKEMGLKIKTVDIPVTHYGSKSKKQIDNVNSKQSEINERKLFNKWINRKDRSKHKIEANKPTILFRRKGVMGDVLLTTPILIELKNKYPHSRIVYETDCPEIIAGNPYIDDIVKEEPKLKKYDIVLTPKYEVDMTKNAIITMANQCSINLKKAKLEIYLTEDDTKHIQKFLRPNQNHIVFHTGQVGKNKEWMIDRFAKVASYYKKKGYEILEVGNSQTQYMGVGRDCRGLPIKHTAALIKKCILLIGVDSLCANIAKAVGTPACVIYGCVHPFSRASDAIEYPIRIEDIECKECMGRIDREWADCDKPEVYCLTRITPDRVIETMNECILKESKNPKEEIIVPKYFAPKQKSAPGVEIQLEEIAEKKRRKQGRRRIYKKENPQSVDNHKIF